MLTSLIKLSIENRFLVLVLTGLMAAGGVYSAMHLPIDAVPDMTNTQVTVITTAGALSPLEVERYITYPVEWTMAGLPRLDQLRSTSQFGLSREELLAGLSEKLPGVVDGLTPAGRLPTTDEMNRVVSVFRAPSG